MTRATALRSLALLVSLGVATIAGADAAAPAPAAKLLSTDTAVMGKPFALDYFNWSIASIVWMPDSAPLMQKAGVSSNQDMGSLVIVSAVKNNSDTSWNAPSPVIQAIFKDGSSSGTSEASRPYTSSGRSLDGTAYPPGAGATISFIVPNIPQPTAANPITKLLFRQTYTDLKPQLIRMLAPPIPVPAATPSPAP